MQPQERADDRALTTTMNTAGKRPRHRRSTLRLKTLMIVSVTIVGLLFILAIPLRIVLLDSFIQLEEQSVQTNVERVVSALSEDLERLGDVATDYAAWDDTYAFVEDSNPDYIEANMVDETFINIRVNLLMILDSSDEIVFAKAFDLNQEQETPLPEGLHNPKVDLAPLLDQHNGNGRKTGLVLLPGGPLLVAAHPILTSDKMGPSRGTLLFGRYLDDPVIARIAERTRLSLDLRRADDPQLSADLQEARRTLWRESDILVQPLSAETVAGYTLLEDIHKNPALLVRVEMPRRIYTQGKTTIFYFVVSLIAAGLIFGGAVMLLLERVVLSRLARLSSRVSEIGAQSDFAARVPPAGNDELSDLAKAINGMLDALEEAEHKIEQQANHLRHGMELARDIQIGLLPQRPPWSEDKLIVAARSLPASEVGGDFYTFVAFRENRMGIAIGDISGKGFGAALMMALVSSTLEAQAREVPQPGRLLSMLNRRLGLRLQTNRMNAAVLYMLIDLDRGMLHVANAGMIAPLLIRNGQVQMIDVQGLPLGTLHDAQYPEITVDLRPRDVLMLVSDGVVEAHSPDREIFGFERLEQALRGAATTRPQQLIDHLLAEVTGFIADAEQADDMTLIALRPNLTAPQSRT
ncbi:MAG: hypothetical protein KatS3mg057_3123 [Herpetosiphonaceae bacterium]|nr:MAG: hypothetical protein KatS3mg057_3123 [Herpetosiphonaceae bacterium]